MTGIWEFSPKQRQVLTWWAGSGHHYDGILCDGAIRSGKTLSLGLSFLLWSFLGWPKPRNRDFALCGATLTSLRRNLVEPLALRLREEGFRVRLVLSRNLLEVGWGEQTNRYHLFSGGEEGSAALIQGATLAGVLFDEAALLNQSFVEQAVARCSEEGSRFWFSCNPEHPGHWFYREWVAKVREKNLLYLHFTMEDNPGLSPAVRQRYERLYTGQFYQRFVLGRWVSASGVVYPMFSREIHLVEERPVCARYYISCDYGTVNPCSMGLWGERDGVWYRLAEYYYDPRQHGGALRTDEEHYAGLEALAGEHRLEGVVADPSAASFLTCIRRHGRFRVIPGQNRVLDGIRVVSGMLREGRLKVHPSCQGFLQEIENYRWDQRSGQDRPVKEEDHAMDETRYFAMEVEGEGQKGGFFAVSCERGDNGSGAAVS